MTPDDIEAAAIEAAATSEENTMTIEEKRRVCVVCGADRHISRYPKKGKGRSRTCRACIEAETGAETEMESTEPATIEEPTTPTLPTTPTSTEIAAQHIDPELMAGPVPTKQVAQILMMAKDLRRTARELRNRARENMSAENVKWVDAMPARMLDTAAVQLELLCR